MNQKDLTDRFFATAPNISVYSTKCPDFDPTWSGQREVAKQTRDGNQNFESGDV